MKKFFLFVAAAVMAVNVMAVDATMDHTAYFEVAEDPNPEWGHPAYFSFSGVNDDGWDVNLSIWGASAEARVYTLSAVDPEKDDVYDVYISDGVKNYNVISGTITLTAIEKGFKVVAALTCQDIDDMTGDPVGEQYALNITMSYQNLPVDFYGYSMEVKTDGGETMYRAKTGDMLVKLVLSSDEIGDYNEANLLYPVEEWDDPKTFVSNGDGTFIIEKATITISEEGGKKKVTATLNCEGEKVVNVVMTEKAASECIAVNGRSYLDEDYAYDYDFDYAELSLELDDDNKMETKTTLKMLLSNVTLEDGATLSEMDNLNESQSWVKEYDKDDNLVSKSLIVEYSLDLKVESGKLQVDGHIYTLLNGKIAMSSVTLKGDMPVYVSPGDADESLDAVFNKEVTVVMEDYNPGVLTVEGYTEGKTLGVYMEIYSEKDNLEEAVAALDNVVLPFEVNSGWGAGTPNTVSAGQGMNAGPWGYSSKGGSYVYTTSYPYAPEDMTVTMPTAPFWVLATGSISCKVEDKVLTITVEAQNTLAKDAKLQIICDLSATGCENAEAAVKVVKAIENGQLIINRGGEKFNVVGAKL